MNVVPPRHRLSRRLPLIITAVLCVIVGGMSWASYVQIRRATLDASEAHLSSAAAQVADMLDASLKRLRHDIGDHAADARTTSALASENPAAVRPLLDSLRTHTPQLLALGIWTASGKLIAESGSEHLTLAGRSALMAHRRPDGISPIISVHDTLVYALLAPIALRGDARDTAGFLVETRSFGDRANTSALSRLLGDGARLILGNRDGTLWTDLARPVAAPPARVVAARRGEYAAADGSNQLGVGAPMASAPWDVWVDEPTGTALETARGFIAVLALVAMVFVIGGGVVVWLVVFRALRPLEDLHRAASSLSLGGSPIHVTVRSDDEIGGLARTFNGMAESVRSAGQELMDRAETLERRNVALLESERRYRQLVDQAPDAVLVHRDGTIVFANANAALMLGAENVDQLIGSPILDVVDESARAEAAERTAAIRDSGVPSSLAELHLRRLDGRPVLAEVCGTLVHFDGAPAVQTLARDISGRRLLEEQLRQSQKMDAIGRLAGGVAHDFNNLLTIINTYSEFLLGSIDASDPRRSDVEEIRHAAASAGRLTRQMLAFSRKQVLAQTLIDVNEAISGMAGMLHRVMGDEVHVVTHLQRALHPILADAGQLEQVLVNLAVNARDAMPNGGTLRIETGQVTLDDGFEAQGHQRLIPAGHYVMLAVSDTGVGMADDVKSRIFEPFFTTKEVGRGTGLGLATVYGIVKQSGGFIWVYSEPGRGSSFKIYFPAQTDAEGMPTLNATGEYPIPARETAEILLVEDDATVRAAVRRILERSPHHIHEAGSPVQAIEMFKARQGRYDLVVTDMMMPAMTGAELVRELRERNHELRAIIMSGYSEETTSRDWRLPPNAVFLEKPIAPNKLLRCIADLLGAEAATSP